MTVFRFDDVEEDALAFQARKATVNVRYPAWSPRNDQVVFEYGETTGNVWVAPLPTP